jgi:hypothetical protein
VRHALETASRAEEARAAAVVELDAVRRALASAQEVVLASRTKRRANAEVERLDAGPPRRGLRVRAARDRGRRGPRPRGGGDDAGRRAHPRGGGASPGDHRVHRARPRAAQGRRSTRASRRSPPSATGCAKRSPPARRSGRRPPRTPPPRRRHAPSWKKRCRARARSGRG